MSSYLSFVLRHQQSIRVFKISSGALSSLFDPRLYAGEAGAVEAFAKNALRSGDEDGILFAPLGSGIVVLDVDRRQQWDLQSVCPLPYLSVSPDRSWLHFELWRSRGWFVEGLVDPTTGVIVAPLASHHTARSIVRQTATFLDALGADQAPRLRIAPDGWTFRSYGPGPGRTLDMFADLKASGFILSAATEAKWGDWMAGRAARSTAVAT